jgi:polyisoprenoid-binding protein YceI
MRSKNMLLALAVLALPAFGADYSLDLKPENTKVQWTLGDVLHTVHGTFRLKQGKIDFDTETGKASGQVVVDVASGNSGSEARDSRMHSNVLESAKYPEAIFVPVRVEGTLSVPGTSNVKVHGTFTIHGASHEMAIDVQATVAADQIRATMSFDIPYVAWGMKDPSNFMLKVNKTVQLSIEAAGPLRKQ